MSINNEEYAQENPFGLETESDFHDKRRNVTISFIKEFTNNKDTIKILDVGCGKGNITRIIHEQIPNAYIDAIDIAEKAIEQAVKEAITGINYSLADAMTFGGFGYSYDIIVLNNIYEHVENPSGMLINLKMILKEDGAFIISTPNRYHIKNILKKIFGLKIAIPHFHITEYSIGQIYDHHAYAGLKVRSIYLPKFRRERPSISDIVIFSFLQPLANNYFKLLKSRTRVGILLFIVSSK
jgi:SAM-dependent methyltransferase